MSLRTNFPWNSERPKIELSKCRGRLSTGETEQPALNNGFGPSSKRLKRNCSLGDHSPAARRPQSGNSNGRAHSSVRFDSKRLHNFARRTL